MCSSIQTISYLFQVYGLIVASWRKIFSSSVPSSYKGLQMQFPTEASLVA